MKETEQVN